MEKERAKIGEKIWIKKLHFTPCGCKVNQYETNAMMQQFATKGYDIVDFEEKADANIINKCNETNISDIQSRKM